MKKVYSNRNNSYFYTFREFSVLSAKNWNKKRRFYIPAVDEYEIKLILRYSVQ